MFMQIDFIRKSCGGRPRIAKKEWKYFAAPCCGRKFAFSFFLLFYSFPERIYTFFSLFSGCFFTLVQNYFFLSFGKRALGGLGLVGSKAKAGLKCGIVLCSTSHTRFLSLSRSRESFLPESFFGSSRALTNTLARFLPHFYGSPF